MKNYAKISSIEGIKPDEILIKEIGREEVDWSDHSHSKHQLIFTLTGTLHIIVGDERHFITARHLVWIPAGTTHQLTSNNAQISLIVCYFTMPVTTGNSLEIFTANEFVANNLRHICHLGLISQEKAPEWFGFSMNLFDLIPIVCRRATFSVQPYIVSKNSRLYPILEYLGRNYMDDIGIATVARHFALSVRNLTRIFTKENIRFVSYLNYLRIVRALELLSDNAMSIEQISYAVGFSSPTSFNRVFKQITGNPPSFYLP